MFQHRRLNRFFIEAYLRLLRVLLSTIFRCDTFHPQPAPLGGCGVDTCVGRYAHILMWTPAGGGGLPHVVDRKILS